MTTNRAASSRLERSAHAEVEIILHPIPTADSKPYIIAFGPDRHLWFCESGTSKIGRFDPDRATFTEFDIPTLNAKPPNGVTGPSHRGAPRLNPYKLPEKQKIPTMNATPATAPASASVTTRPCFISHSARMHNARLCRN